MRGYGKVKQKLKDFRPPLVTTTLFAVVFSALSLFLVLTNFGEKIPDVIIYIIHSLSAIFLSLSVLAIVRFVRKITPKKRTVNVVKKSSFFTRLIEDYSFRTIIFAVISLIFNVLLAFSKVLAGLYYKSNWFIVLSGYYILLSVMRYIVLRFGVRLSKSKEGGTINKEYKVQRLTGILILFLAVLLQGVVILIVRREGEFLYEGNLIYLAAAYDFYCLIYSIVFMIKMRKKHTPTIVSIKSISFCTSLVSILSLQTAMLASFGGGIGPDIRNLLNTLTGTAVCLTIVSWGIFLLIKSNRELIRNKIENNNKKIASD